MATINKTSHSSKGFAHSCYGTMPADKLALYKLQGNTLKNDTVRYISRDTKSVAKRVRAIGTYRMIVHGVTTPKVPSCLTNIAHYFLIPMTRSEGSNSNEQRSERRSETVEAVSTENAEATA
jgi:hypothetical protein